SGSAASSSSGSCRGSSKASVFRVLARVAAHALDGVLNLVQRDLVVGRAQEVDADDVREAQEIKEHVRGLEARLLEPRRAERAALVLRQPLKDLEELGRLGGERHRQVLRRMKLIPIARGRELAQALLQLSQ